MSSQKLTQSLPQSGLAWARQKTRASLKLPLAVMMRQSKLALPPPFLTSAQAFSMRERSSGCTKLAMLARAMERSSDPLPASIFEINS